MNLLATKNDTTDERSAQRRGLRQPAAALIPAACCGITQRTAAGCVCESGSRLPQSIGFAVLILASTLHAGPRTSANYSIATDTADAGGARAVSVNYSNDGSAGSVAGLSTVASPTETSKSGYIGQLYEVTGLTLTSAAATVNETATVQLAAWQALDDASFLAVPAAAITWSVQSGPIAGIDTSGMATAGTVYQDTAATAKGIFAGNTGTLGLTVLNVNDDDLPGYTGDGIPDAWQVQYFGLNNPNAAPGIVSDGSGLTNQFKYIAGLIPGNAASKFILNVNPVSGQPGQRSIVFNPSLTDRSYTVQFSTDLIHWNTLSGPFAGNGSTQTVTDTNPGTARCYRVQVTKP